ncbi:hypothetical protein SteCoe_7045 [Stentor coeruleus]|uniref:RGS domain-containing protein n=1 Tax=Stentor coeruleus TaxID=5963 RepID=A0A1R2CNG0_9CILI|nr:hypothetical protein SteCoe_7045 [Stentor coeruleus]
MRSICNIAEFFLVSGTLSVFFCWNFYYLLRNRYDLNALNRGWYLMMQEFFMVYIYCQCGLNLVYLQSEIIIVCSSVGFLISDYAYTVTYMLFVYRIVLLNKIEFGQIGTKDYSKAMKRLNNLWNIKISFGITFTLSTPAIIAYFLICDENSILENLNTPFEKTYKSIFAQVCFAITVFEYCLYLALFIRVLFGKFRITLKIEIFLNLLIWLLYSTLRPISLSPFSKYSFYVPLRTICLNAIIIISLHIRTFIKGVPYPPLLLSSSIFIYEHQKLYEYFSCYVNKLEDKSYSFALKLGLYISMFKLDNKTELIEQIEMQCLELGIKGFSIEKIEEMEMYARDRVDQIYGKFTDSLEFEELVNDSAKNRSALMFL